MIPFTKRATFKLISRYLIDTNWNNWKEKCGKVTEGKHLKRFFIIKYNIVPGSLALTYASCWQYLVLYWRISSISCFKLEFLLHNLKSSSFGSIGGLLLTLLHFSHPGFIAWNAMQFWSKAHAFFASFSELKFPYWSFFSHVVPINLTNSFPETKRKKIYYKKFI